MIDKEESDKLELLLKESKWKRQYRKIKSVYKKNNGQFTLGTRVQRYKGSVTLGTDSELWIFANFLVSKYRPDFTFTTIQVNKNICCKRHVDSLNQGTSLIIAVGPYEGGHLYIEKEDSVEKINIKDTFYEFDGSKYYHYNDDFIGDRYSMIFYCHRSKQKRNHI